jgi:serine/threonine-protein kinase RsbW
MSALGKHTPVVSGSYPAVPETVPCVRATLAAFARAQGAEAERVEALRLAASEAVTNAVLHAYAGDEPGEVHVTAARADGEVWVLIADDGRGLQPREDSPGLGMGLALITSVSDSVSIVPRSGGGTELRLHFRLRARRPVPSARAQRRGSVASARVPAASRFSTTA